MSLTWESKKVKLSELQPAKYNPRKKVEGEFKKQLESSLNKFNLADPIVINLNNTIIGGHQRYFILKEKGVEEVDVRVPNRLLDEKEERELNLRLNKNVGEWDLELLSTFDNDMLEEVGFDDVLSKKEEKTESEGEVEFTEELLEEHNYVVLYFDNDIDWLQALTLLGLEQVKALHSKDNFVCKGLGRVIKGREAIEKIKGNNENIGVLSEL